LTFVTAANVVVAIEMAFVFDDTVNLGFSKASAQKKHQRSEDRALATMH